MNPFKEKFLAEFRNNLPADFRSYSNKELEELFANSNPELNKYLQEIDLKETAFAPPEYDDFLDTVLPGIETAWYRGEQTVTGAVNSILVSIAKETMDPMTFNAYKRGRIKIYNDIKAEADKKILEDPSTLALQRWNAANPFEWGKSFTDRAHFGRLFSSVLTSAGVIMTSAFAGGLVGSLASPGAGNVMGAIAGISAAFTMEGGSAFTEAYDEAKRLGLSDEKAIEVASNTGLTYGAVSALLESLVPIGVMKSMLLPQRASAALYSKFARKAVEKIAAAGTKELDKTTMRVVSELAQESLGFLGRTKRFVVSQLMKAGEEGVTEATQFVAQKLIQAGYVDPKGITAETVSAILSDPELQASIAGGIIGGKSMGFFSSISAARGGKGIYWANYVINQEKNWVKEGIESPGVLSQTLIKKILDSEDLSHVEKVAFARRYAKNSPVMFFDTSETIGSQVGQTTPQEEAPSTTTDTEATATPSPVSNLGAKGTKKAPDESQVLEDEDLDKETGPSTKAPEKPEPTLESIFRGIASGDYSELENRYTGRNNFVRSLDYAVRHFQDLDAIFRKVSDKKASLNFMVSVAKGIIEVDPNADIFVEEGDTVNADEVGRVHLQKVWDFLLRANLQGLYLQEIPSSEIGGQPTYGWKEVQDNPGNRRIPKKRGTGVKSPMAEWKRSARRIGSVLIQLKKQDPDKFYEISDLWTKVRDEAIKKYKYKEADAFFVKRIEPLLADKRYNLKVDEEGAQKAYDDAMAKSKSSAPQQKQSTTQPNAEKIEVRKPDRKGAQPAFAIQDNQNNTIQFYGKTDKAGWDATFGKRDGRFGLDNDGQLTFRPYDSNETIILDPKDFDSESPVAAMKAIGEIQKVAEGKTKKETAPEGKKVPKKEAAPEEKKAVPKKEVATEKESGRTKWKRSKDKGDWVAQDGTVTTKQKDGTWVAEKGKKKATGATRAEAYENLKNPKEEKPTRDPLYDKAKNAVIVAGQSSIELLQKELGVGHARAIRLIEALIADGVVDENGKLVELGANRKDFRNESDEELVRNIIKWQAEYDKRKAAKDLQGAMDIEQEIAGRKEILRERGKDPDKLIQAASRPKLGSMKDAEDDAAAIWNEMTPAERSDYFGKYAKDILAKLRSGTKEDIERARGRLLELVIGYYRRNQSLTPSMHKLLGDFGLWVEEVEPGETAEQVVDGKKESGVVKKTLYPQIVSRKGIVVDGKYKFGVDLFAGIDTKESKSTTTEGKLTLHSGGATGSDTYFEQKVSEQGGEVKAYSFKGHNTKSKNRVELTPEELKQGEEALHKANKTLKRRVPGGYIGNLLRRNWYQVRKSDKVFAVGEFGTGGIVKGGTGWAVQMAVDMGKPVAVFDQRVGKWYEYNHNTKEWQELSETPVLVNNFAGVGTRKLNEAGKKAIDDLFASRRESKEKKQERKSKAKEERDIDDTGIDPGVFQPFHESMPKAKHNKKLVSKILARLQRQFPFVDVEAVERIVDENGTEYAGKAVDALIQWVEDGATIDTLPHEFAHVFVNIFRYHPLVQKSIESFQGDEEALVQYMGEYYAQRMMDGKLKSSIKRILSSLVRAAKKVFGIKDNMRFARELAKAFYKVDTISGLPPNYTYSGEASYNESNSIEYDVVANILSRDTKIGDTVAERMREKLDGDLTKFYQSYLRADFGVYIDDGIYAEMVKIAKSYVNRPPADSKNLYEMVAELIDLLNERTGSNIDFDKKINDTGFINATKRWFISVNNLVEIYQPDGGITAFDPTSMRAVFEIVLNDFKSWGGTFSKVVFRPRSNDDLVTHRPHPSRAIMDFVEGQGFPTVIRVSAKNIYARIRGRRKKDGTPYDFHKGYQSMNFKVDAAFLRKLSLQFTKDFQDGKVKNLFFFLGETGGDNSQFLFSGVPEHMMEWSSEDAIEYFEREVELQEDPEDRRIMGIIVDYIIKDIEKNQKSNPLYGVQLAAFNEAWKEISGVRYLIRQYEGKKTIQMMFKRAKLDFSRGSVPYGAGDSSVFIINSREVEFEIPMHDGTIRRMSTIDENDRNIWDGWLMVSRKRIERIGNAVGSSGKIFKTVIRHLNKDPLSDGHKVDYVSMKHMEMIPPEGMKIFKGDEEIARYEGGTWKTPDGREFDIVASQDEVKDRDGIFKENYAIHELPQMSTRVLHMVEESKEDSAGPIAVYELMLEAGLVENENFLEIYNKINEYTSKLGDKYLEYLFSLRSNPRKLREFLMERNNEDEVLEDVQKGTRVFSNGGGLFIRHFLRQALPFLKNKLLVDSLFKWRQNNITKTGGGTKLYFMPDTIFGLKDDEIAVSGDNKTVMKYLEKIYDGKVSLKGKSLEERIALINEWLQKNDVVVNTHRMPIQNFSKLVQRKIRYVSKPGYGQVVFLNPKDVWDIHDGDHDGDTLFVEWFEDKSLQKAWKKFLDDPEVKKRERTVDLTVFKIEKGFRVFASLANIFEALDGRSVLQNMEGVAVNAKTLSTLMAFKEIKILLDSGAELRAIGPNERVLMDYWEVLPPYWASDGITDDIKTMTKKQTDDLEKQGVTFLEIDGKWYMETTREHELSIILQAAVDNEKFGLFGDFKLVDARGAKIGLKQFLLAMAFEKDGKRGGLTKKEIRTISMVADEFTLSTFRAGKTENYNEMTFNSIFSILPLKMAKIFNFEKDEFLSNEAFSSRIEESVNSKISKRIAEGSKAKNFSKIVALEGVNRTSPLENFFLNLVRKVDAYNKEFFGRNVEINGPFGFSEKLFNAAHKNAMEALDFYIAETIKTVQKRKDGLKYLMQGIKDGQALVSEFLSVYEEISKEFKKIGVTQEERTEYGISIDYREQFAPWRQKWFDYFYNGKLTEDQREMVKLGVTIQILRGIAFDNKSGRKTNISKVGMLPPMEFLHEGMMRVYGDFYYNELNSSRGDETEFRAKMPKTNTLLRNLKGCN